MARLKRLYSFSRLDFTGREFFAKIADLINRRIL
jgi:hypothetical protein